MNPVPESALAAEARARVLIDAQLDATGNEWRDSGRGAMRASGLAGSAVASPDDSGRS